MHVFFFLFSLSLSPPLSFEIGHHIIVQLVLNSRQPSCLKTPEYWDHRHELPRLARYRNSFTFICNVLGWVYFCALFLFLQFPLGFFFSCAAISFCSRNNPFLVSKRRLQWGRGAHAWVNLIRKVVSWEVHPPVCSSLEDVDWLVNLRPSLKISITLHTYKCG